MTDVHLDNEAIGSSSHIENKNHVDLEPVDLFESESRTEKIVRKVKAAWARRKNDIVELKQLSRIALPLSVTYIAQFLITTTNLFFVGKQGTKEELAGAAFGYTYCNVFGYALGIGMMSAQDTLCSQAFGAGNFKRVGVILQRTIIIVMLMCIPLSFIWGFSEQILIALQQDPIVSAKAGEFIRAMIPSLPAYMFFEAVKRWLQMQSVVMPILYIVLVIAGLNVFITWLFVDGFGLGYTGAPIAIVVTYYLAVAVELGYVFWKKLHVQTWPGFSRDAWKEWPTYLYYGSFGMIMICAEWWGFEIHTLLAGLMGTVPVAAQTVILNTMQLIFMIPLGVQIGVTTRVGNSLGAGDAQGAARAAKVATVAIIISQCIIAVGFFIARNSWGWVFTNEEEVVQTVAATLPIACAFMFADGGQGVMSGAMRGIGKQKIGGFTNLMGYYVIGIPIAYFFGFHLEMGIRGLWIGLLASSVTCFVVFVIVLTRADWEHEAMMAQKRSQLEDAGLHVPVTTDPSLTRVEEGKSSPPSSPPTERHSNGTRL